MMSDRRQHLTPPITATTTDAWYDGSLSLTQPTQGLRATSDALLLGVAVAAAARHILELGIGAGAVMLIMMKRLPQAHITGIDWDDGLLGLAAKNAGDNGFAGRLTLHQADITRARLMPDYDQVVMNPPYNDPTSTPPPSQSKRAAKTADFCGAWLAAAATALQRRGVLTLICRADVLDRLMPALTQADFGEVVIKPIHPLPNRPAHRLLVRARKGIKHGVTMLPPLVMVGGEYEGLTHGGFIDLTPPGRKQGKMATGEAKRGEATLK